MADNDQSPATARIELPPLPADAVPIVALRNVVLFPGIVLPITLGREESIAAAQEAVKQWHFRPYLQSGQPVETEARITVNFTIFTQ